MAMVNEMLVGAANLAARTLFERQEASATPSSTYSSSVNIPLSSSSVSTTTTPVHPTATMAQETDSSDNPSSQPTSSPLLFFVALGFGVVFTNLWIIVGVKYCFRYNARNRALRMAEDGEPITMENMPRPHRRRREKKLMTMDEVNEKFPMQKYKNWVASRAQEGLPTTGGVSAPASRANSVQDVEGVVPEVSKERDSTDERPTTSATNRGNAADSSENVKEKNEGPATSSAAAATAATAATAVTSAPSSAIPTRDSDSPNDQVHKDDDDEDEDERIDAALPPECLGTSGDTCAICIDTLEDDDDVRGLTCGHAFHAGCLDPWLTSRRACCPLCKADYYTPKPRRTQTNTNGELPATPADGTNPTDGSATSQAPARSETRRREPRMNLPQPPQTAWQSFVARGRTFIPGNRAQLPQQRSSGNRQRVTDTAGTSRPRNVPSRTQSATAANTSTTAASETQLGMWNRFRGAFPHFQLQNNRSRPENVTPGQLESGVRS
ncbi:hypothetical protein MKZ38_008895 [Zalerion maritima]|uniref:RING-type domain-containing protein n=1 Tax=Zalerion maritima TaxID=339359 RepID=A0AAD5RVL2_9PEZI|nr:hypothetical protein MKZ38_008895 [Zalerion maritima]